MDSSSSRWPEPAMPAIPKISPPRAVKPTPSSFFTPSASSTVRPSTVRRGLGSTEVGPVDVQGDRVAHHHIGEGLGIGLGRVHGADVLPLRSTATRSEMAMTSWSLCVMMTMAFPSAFIVRRMAKRRSGLLRG